MPDKRSFSEEVKAKSIDYHGTAHYARLDHADKSDHIYLTLEEAVKFSLFVQSCVMSLNRHDRREKSGRDMGMMLSLQAATNSLVVAEKLVKPK